MLSIILLLTLGITILYVTGIFRLARAVEVMPVSKIYPAQAITVLNASGYVVAQRKAAVSSKSTGRLEYLGIEEGSRVKKGAIIASLENADLMATRDKAAANLQVSEAQLKEARAEEIDAHLNLNRQQALIKADLIARQDFDTAQARYHKALAAVEAAQSSIRAARAAQAEAQTALEFSFIRAPFDGVILTKNAEVGEVVAPFGSATNARAAVATMADMDSLMVEADVAESNITQVKLKQAGEIQLDAMPQRRFRGEVHMIVPTADRSKATILTKVAFLDKDPGILPEMSAKVAFLARPLKNEEEKPRLAVSPKALLPHQGQWLAYVVQDNRVKAVPVQIGPQLGDLVEVKAGLQEGDKVVLAPDPTLKDGDKVSIKEK